MQGVTILIVDGDADIVSQLKSGLTFRGFHVVTAADGAAALRAMDSHQPSLVLADLALLRTIDEGSAGEEGSDGREGLAAHLLRQERRRIPLIVMSADPNAVHESNRLGAIACIVKPFDVDRLFASLTAALDGDS